MRQRPGVVGEVPAHGGGQVARLGLQALGPVALAGAAQRPVGLLGQRPVVVGVPAADLGGVGPGRQPLGHERADGLQHPQPGAVVGAGRGRSGCGGPAPRTGPAPRPRPGRRPGRRPRRSSRPRTPPRSPAATARRPPAGPRSTPPWPAGCVAARAGPPRPFRARPATWPAGASRASGSSSRVRAAASSIASGRPSSRRQISATAAALLSVRAKPGRAARARSTNSATAGDAASSAIGTPVGVGGQRQRRHRVLPLRPQPQHRTAGRQDHHAATAGQQRVDVAGRRRPPARGCRG